MHFFIQYHNLSYYLMLLIHVRTNGMARSNPDWFMSDYMASGAGLKLFGAQLVFSSVLPVGGHSPRREG